LSVSMPTASDAMTMTVLITMLKDELCMTTLRCRGEGLGFKV
jgi:hypothetical protein